MSLLSSISSHDEEFDSGQSDHTPSSSPSQCNSSTSILTVAVAAEPAQVSESFSPAPSGSLSKRVDLYLKDPRCSLQNRESSATSTFRTAWTDSKHSSYLDYMEANFVQSMFGCNHLSEDVEGMMTSEYQQYGSTDESDEDSAQSRLRVPLETMEFKMFDHRNRTWKACARPTFPAHTPLILLASNPWVKHFRPKKPSATAPAARIIPSEDMVALPMTKGIERADHVPRFSNLNDMSGSNPGKEGLDSQAGLRKRCIQNLALLDEGVDERDSSRKRQSLCAPYDQLLA